MQHKEPTRDLPLGSEGGREGPRVKVPEKSTLIFLILGLVIFRQLHVHASELYSVSCTTNSALGNFSVYHIVHPVNFCTDFIFVYFCDMVKLEFKVLPGYASLQLQKLNDSQFL